MTVTGSDEIEILLPQKPFFTSVKFVKDQILVPCDHYHNHKDHLSWNVKYCKYTRTYRLRIEWTVRDIRTIKWKYSFKI
jgi:hypothetical protein